MAIYRSLMANAAPSPPDSSSAVKDMFATRFARETGVAPSPFFALDIATQLEDAQQAEEFWRLAEAEFFNTPPSPIPNA